jgi:RimJ/RimL family protein N-acetyltransferase
MANIPSIETERLILRPHKLEDFPFCAAMWADPVVTRHIGGIPSTEQQSWARMTSYLGHWSLMGFGYWALEEKKTGRYIGELGFADFKRGLDPAPELGWALVSMAHGKGFASEAVQAASAWGDARFERTVCLINPANLASIRVAQKCGFRKFRETAYKGEAVFLFERMGAVPK